MDTELVRFRVDASIKKKAEAICEKLGYDLPDVLVGFLNRFVREGALPFDVGISPVEGRGSVPFGAYRDCLWRDYRRLEAEVVLALLSRFVADRATQIGTEQRRSRPDKATIQTWQKELEDARALARVLDPNDADAVAEALGKYGPLVRAMK
jgi:RelB antitoxin of RelBE toxin-antitoxin system